jgi:two-component system capsular synthesis sensor histidine kinase RcsC
MRRMETENESRPGGELDALRRHQRRLLYGGGGLLSLLILLAAVAVIGAAVNGYRERQRQVLRDGQAALDTFLIQRERGVMRSLHGNDVLWTQRRDDLVRNGTPYAKTFAADGEQVVVRAGELAVPWLVLARSTAAMPQALLAAYLGLVYESSSHTSTTVAEREAPGSLAVYAYDDSGSFFTMTGVPDEAALLKALKVPNREQALTRLILPTARLAPTATGPDSFDSARKGLFVSFFGSNPFNGEPSLVGVMNQHADGRLYYRIVVFDAVSQLKERLRLTTPESFMVVTRAGGEVLESGPFEDGIRERMDDLREAGLWKAWPEKQLSAHADGTFLVADDLKGIDWAIVHVYTWRGMLRALGWQAGITAAIAAIILALLWTLLLRMDRRVFAPALAGASRVYESEALNRAIITTSPVGLCLLDPDGPRPILQNAMMEEYAGRLVDDPLALYRRLLERATVQGDGSEFPLAIDLPGERRWTLQVAAARADYRDRPAWLFALRDVTLQAAMEESLRQAKRDSESARQQAESASRAKSSFVAVMSHEIRTPLNGILGHLELMGRSALDDTQRQRLRRISQSADSLLGIVNDVLDFSRIEAGQVDVDPVAFALRPLIEQVTLLFAPEAQRKGLRLYLGIDPTLAPGYVADVARIRQVLNNLLGNAVKFTESGRVTLRVGPAEGVAAMLRFEIVDSGIGISDEQIAQVFEPFSQADASISRRFGGSGLGLALCRQIADLLGGTLDAESTLGVGSVFRFEVPASIDEGAQPTHADALTGQRIALLSAAAEWRTDIASLLASWGAGCVVAASPSGFDPGSVRDAVLVIFGAQVSWNDEDEAALAAIASKVVRARIDGPLCPEPRADGTHISCYSSDALLVALRPGDAPAAVSLPTVEPRGRGRVLLADDHEVNRELIQQQLEALGFVVDAAVDGEDALQQWQEGRYVAVVTDINMPRMNGYELTAALRARGATLPILAATATALSSEKQRCHEVGVTELLLKPLSLDRLEAAMARAVRVAVVPVDASLLRSGHLPEKVRRVFVETGTRDIDQLLDAVAHGDTPVVLQRLHAIKGVLLMIGERDVAGLFGALEVKMERGGAGPIGPALDEAVVAMRGVLDRHRVQVS